MDNKSPRDSSFRWEPQPEAAQLVSKLIDHFLANNEDIASLSQRVQQETGTRLVDWIDSIFLPKDFEQGNIEQNLAETGFVPQESNPQFWHHPEGIFPRVSVGPTSSFGWNETDAELILAIKVSDVSTFAQVHCLEDSSIYGEPGTQLRVASFSPKNNTLLVGIERKGWQELSMPDNSKEQIELASQHHRKFLRRNRSNTTAQAGFEASSKLIEDATKDLGTDLACYHFFAAERTYWMSRNHAARVQHDRQQRLGLGWANHDHHTFRSSRSCFHLLIGALEQLGFQCRERFYAGQEAGWGAQVLEQPQAGIVVFSDVDLSPEEVATDYAHEQLPPHEQLGTVGLWCALHGESFLEAGMHHLECQFDFEASCQQLAEAGVESMAPFTNFPFLKQAFTQGEMWPVMPDRLKAAISKGHISQETAEQFQREGALGSHLEILERNDGYKGFNQTGVSDIILRTDPRKQ